MAKTLIVLGKAWLWVAVALTLLAYGYVWWTEGFWQMEKSGMLSFSMRWRSSQSWRQASSY